MDDLWFLYVVECCDNSLYCGVTTDVYRRVREHNTSKRAAKYTRSRRPVRLIHTETYCGRSAALKEEAAFKCLTHAQKLLRVCRAR